MHILFLTDNFPPEVNAPASRTHEHCRQWVAAGEQVTVITCAPNFPTGKVFEGYHNRLWQQEAIDGIRVIRVWSYVSANEGFVKRILDYTSYMASAFIASLAVRRVDVVVGTSPQFFTAVGAWAVAAVKRVPFIFELRDLWPESIKAVGAMKESVVIRWLEKLELFLYRRAARVVSVTHSFRDTLMRRGIDGGKIDVVTNGVDVSRFSPRPRDPVLEQALGFKDCFVAGYIGTHGMAHGLETLLDAAQQLKEHAQGRHIRLLFLGDGARKSELQAQAQRRQLHNVRFVDTVPKAEVARYWSLLDASIIHLRKTELFTTVIPSKLFECMGMGIPVLHGVAGESADIVRREGVGIPFEPENAAQLVEGLLLLQRDVVLRQTLRSAALHAAGSYDRAALANKMLEILRAEGAQDAGEAQTPARSQGTHFKAVEIPMLRESAAFVRRLSSAARQFGDSNHRFFHRVNWSHRYEEDFYRQESQCFRADAVAYLSGQSGVAPRLVDVFAKKMRARQVLSVLLKVAAHGLFRALGRIADMGHGTVEATTYRKCYVDDIELVFDRQEAGVVRAVYPFPLSARRQWRYLRYLRQKGHRFRLSGNPYGLLDLLTFVVRRDIASLCRMESRAQVRQAMQVVAQGFKSFQLSDEFDLGSLDFARTLARYPVRVVNSAHGVGKYLPVHAYPEFLVLTKRQSEYYLAVRECTYRFRSLNDLSAARPDEGRVTGSQGVRLVFLSQTFPGLTPIVGDAESAVVIRLNAEFRGEPHVELYYKPHPTRGTAQPPAGFKELRDMSLVNGLDGTIFASLYSTCQIDPAFKGRKVLVRGHLIHPEISFDDAKAIVSLDELVDLVRDSIDGNRASDEAVSPQELGTR